VAASRHPKAALSFQPFSDHLRENAAKTEESIRSLSDPTVAIAAEQIRALAKGRDQDAAVACKAAKDL
jgi:hypothetical protein